MMQMRRKGATLAKIKRQFTRYAIDARKSEGLTQEEAAEHIGCSVNTLQKYESDEIRIHDDVAARMAMVYRDPRLKRMYCEHECAIGCQDGHCGYDKSPEGALLDLLLVDKDRIPQVVAVLRAVSADGRIDDDEASTAAECIAFLDGAEKAIAAVKLQVQRLGSRSVR